MVDIEKHEDHHILSHDRVWDHEVRIRILERDYAEIKEIRSDVKAMQLELTSVKNTLQSFPELVSSAIRAQLAAHEKVEVENQNRIMHYLVAVLLTVFGSAIYLFAEKTIDYFLK